MRSKDPVPFDLKQLDATGKAVHKFNLRFDVNFFVGVMQLSRKGLEDVNDCGSLQFTKRILTG